MLAGACAKGGQTGLRQMKQLHLQTAGELCLAQSSETQAGTATVQAKYQGVQGRNNSNRASPLQCLQSPLLLWQQEQQSWLLEVLPRFPFPSFPTFSVSSSTPLLLP